MKDEIYILLVAEYTAGDKYPDTKVRGVFRDLQKAQSAGRRFAKKDETYAEIQRWSPGDKEDSCCWLWNEHLEDWEVPQ